jgi:hypothetical protein
MLNVRSWQNIVIDQLRNKTETTVFISIDPPIMNREFRKNVISRGLPAMKIAPPKSFIRYILQGPPCSGS